MSGSPPEALISDANVLIDFVAADIDVLEKLAKFTPLYVAIPVIKEVKALSIADARRIGIIIYEPSLEELMEAAGRGGGLSERDKLCYVIAKGNKWACLTNDKLLRRKCEESDIRPVWSLEAMVILHKSGHLSRSHAITTAENMHKHNPRHIHQELLVRFIEQLDK